MPQDYIIEALTPQNRTDNFGNQAYMVKFAEHPVPVYAAFKNPPQIGDKRYGTISQGQYGPRFKGAQRPDFQPGGFQQPAGAPQAPQGYNQAPRAGAPRKSDEERSQDIRWGLCIKEANAYVTKNRADLGADDWAKEVNEYANALYRVSEGPGPVVEEARPADQLPDDDDITDEPIDLAAIPFN